MSITSKKVKAFDVSKLSEKQQKKLQRTYDKMKAKQPMNMTPGQSGMFHTIVATKDLTFKKAPNETVIASQGSYIVLGTDRPSTLASGYGGFGSGQAASIDMVVGRMAGAKKGKGANAGAAVDPSFAADAARIHMSQLTDIDKNFGLAVGKGLAGASSQRSGIGIKADDVRIIGRNSIKIVTGGAQGFGGFGGREPNSLGGKVQQIAPTIELIAGNNSGSKIVWGGLLNPFEKVDYVQRACLGMNTRDAMREMLDLINELWSACFNFSLSQILYNSVLGISYWEPWRPALAPNIGTWQSSNVLMSLFQTRVNSIMFEMNYLWPFGYKYICSRNVKLT